jgi:hypothetical protein
MGQGNCYKGGHCPPLVFGHIFNTGQTRPDRGRDSIGVGVGIGIGSEGQKMGFGHEKPDVNRTPIEYVGWAYRFCETLNAPRNAKDYLLLDPIVAMLTKLGQ